MRWLNVRTLAGWAVVLGLAWLLFTNPVGAAGLVHNVFNLIKAMGNSVATFFSAL